MRKLLTRSLVIALLVGSLVGFANYLFAFRGGTKYDPPIAEDEWRRLEQLPVAQYAEELSSRRKPVTRMQWLHDSVGQSYFWKGIADHSLFPMAGIFIGCVLLGKLQAHDGSQHPANP